MLLACLVGCGTLHAEYVKADRETYHGMQPCIAAGICAVGTASLEGRAWDALNTSWDGRLLEAEAKIKKGE